MSEIMSDSSCIYCEEVDTMEMVQCDVCNEWAHYMCARVGPWIKSFPWSCYWCEIKSNGHQSTDALVTKVDASVGTEGSNDTSIPHSSRNMPVGITMNKAFPCNDKIPAHVSVDEPNMKDQVFDQNEPYELVPISEDRFNGWDKLLKNRNAYGSMKSWYLAINLKDMKKFLKECIVKTFSKQFIPKISFEAGNFFNESNILSCLIETIQEKFKDKNLDNNEARKEIIVAFRRFRDAKAKSDKNKT